MLYEVITHVDLTPGEVLARLRGDADVQALQGFPARSRSQRRFLEGEAAYCTVGLPPNNASNFDRRTSVGGGDVRNNFV